MLSPNLDSIQCITWQTGILITSYIDVNNYFRHRREQLTLIKIVASEAFSEKR